MMFTTRGRIQRNIDHEKVKYAAEWDTAARPTCDRFATRDAIDQLAACERARNAAAHEARVRTREATNHRVEASEELAMLQRAQAQELKALQAGHVQRLRSATHYWQSQLALARSAASEAEASAERAEQLQKKAEIKVEEIARKASNLHAQLQRRLQLMDKDFAELEELADEDATAKTAEADARLASMTEHASVVFARSVSAFESNSQELHAQLSRHHLRTEFRTRFGELCALAKDHSQAELSTDVFHDLSDVIMSVWDVQAGGLPKSLPSPNASSSADKTLLLPSLRNP